MLIKFAHDMKLEGGKLTLWKARTTFTGPTSKFIITMENNVKFCMFRQNV